MYNGVKFPVAGFGSVAILCLVGADGGLVLDLFRFCFTVRVAVVVNIAAVYS
jgi:hypothetical protein